jgi:hypothetical protein
MQRERPPGDGGLSLAPGASEHLNALVGGYDEDPGSVDEVVYATARLSELRPQRR